MNQRSYFPLFCLDLEGVLWPEMWHAVADQTGINDLRFGTQDSPNYESTMKNRISALKAAGIRLAEVQQILDGLVPREGAAEFLTELRKIGQVVVISDTFQQFLKPVQRGLGNTTVFCNTLEVDSDGFITQHIMRSPLGKKGMIEALASQGFDIAAAGDSYNDIGMLQTASWGSFLFAPPKIAEQFPQIPSMNSYKDLLDYWKQSLQIT